MIKNLHKKIMRKMPKSKFIYREFLNKSINDIGKEENTYKEDIDLVGSIQPTPKKTYQQLGLDYSKEYINIYTSNKIDKLYRDNSPDLIIFNGKIYRVASELNWQDVSAGGYTLIMCVRIGFTDD